MISDSLSHPELQRLKEQTASAEAKLQSTKQQYFPTISAIASGGTFEPYDARQNQPTGAWWTAGALVSMPLFTGFLIENQIHEARAQKNASDAATMSVEQALTQQVTNSYLDTVTFVQQIKLAEEQVKRRRNRCNWRNKHKLGLGTVVEVTQSEVAVRIAQTRLAEAQYDYKIAEVTLAYSAGGRSQLEIDQTLR